MKSRVIVGMTFILIKFKSTKKGTSQAVIVITVERE